MKREREIKIPMSVGHLYLSGLLNASRGLAKTIRDLQ